MRCPGYLSLTSVYDPESGSASAYGALTSFSMLAWGLGYFGMPHVLLRFMATEDDKKIKTSRRIATVWVVISMAVAVFIGIAGLGMTKAGALPVLADPERIIITVAQLISSHGVLAAVIAGVIMAGILAATMSTADSQLARRLLQLLAESAAGSVRHQADPEAEHSGSSSDRCCHRDYRGIPGTQSGQLGI